MSCRKKEEKQKESTDCFEQLTCTSEEIPAAEKVLGGGAKQIFGAA